MSDQHHRGQNDDGRDGNATVETQDKERSVAEWTTLGISVAIVLAVVGLIAVFSIQGGDDPPTIVVEPRLDALRQDESGYYLPVAIRNEGDQTAEDVVVQAELATGSGEPETAEITVVFLAGGEQVGGTFVFEGDPTQGELTIRAASFLAP